MRVRVELTSTSRESLVRLLESRTSRPSDALIAAIVYTEEISRTFETHGGPPPGATVRRYANRDELWWQKGFAVFIMNGQRTGIPVEVGRFAKQG